MVINMKHTIICTRNASKTSDEFTGTIDELYQQFQHTITHAYNIQKEYNKVKIAKNIPKSINKFIDLLNAAIFNVSNDRIIALKNTHN